MTVRKGDSWGEPGGLPPDSPIVATNSELRAIVERVRREGSAMPTIGLTGGDLWRTLGARRPDGDIHDSGRLRLPVDIGSALLDGRQHWFASHLIARRTWWRGRVVAVMNAQFLGTWDLAPKSHPNDGLLDISDGDLTLGDRLKARKRLATGSHLPHPAIAVGRVRAESFTFDPPLRVYLDDVDMGTVRELLVRVEPDALEVVA